MGVGDEILAAGQAQRHYDLTGQRSVIVDKWDRVRSHPIWDHNPVIIQTDDALGDSRINVIRNHSGHRPYIVYPFTAESGWTFDRRFAAREHVARIYLTAAELAVGRCFRAEHGPFVLIEPWSKHANLRWPWRHWQALIASRPDITFVQHWHESTDYFLAGATHVHTPTFRDACAILAHAAAYIRGESGMLHAAAALRIPAVAIWGACMDWDVLGGYPTHVGVGVSQSPCGSWLPCDHCAATMDAITPDQVAAGLDLALNMAPLRAVKS